MRIVVFAPSIAGAMAAAGLGTDGEVTVLSWADIEVEGARVTVVPQPRGPAQRLDELALRTAPGRAIRRLTPLDPGVRFWRATRRSPDARAAIGAADLLVAVERDALYAVWRWARKHRPGRARSAAPGAVTGLPAARAFRDKAASLSASSPTAQVRHGPDR